MHLGWHEFAKADTELVEITVDLTGPAGGDDDGGEPVADLVDYLFDLHVNLMEGVGPGQSTRSTAGNQPHHLRDRLVEVLVDHYVIEQGGRLRDLRLGDMKPVLDVLLRGVASAPKPEFQLVEGRRSYEEHHRVGSVLPNLAR